MHLISWKKITTAKKDGGLGLQSTEEKNVALLAKLNWHFHQERNSLWARVLAHKYTGRREITVLNSDLVRLLGQHMRKVK